MKKIVIIILLGIFTFPFLSQSQVLDQKKALYQKKAISFTKMKRTGVGLTIGGAILSVAGVAMMVNGANTYADSDNYSSADDLPSEFYIGYLAAVVGITATVGGVVLWTVGGHRARSYQKKANSLSLNLNPGQRQICSLAYRF